VTATSTAHVEPTTPSVGTGGQRSRGFRPDIEGLRAVAIGLVLIYHAGVRWVPGGFVGVDVFFVISGFLITSLLVREVERTGRVALARFYARRARRLLPAAALALIAAAALTWWLLPITQRRVFGTDIISAAFYVVNWRLADRSVDYLAEDVAASPVQHFWSLAVEEQFYIVWPLLIIAALLVVRRLRTPLRPTLGIALALVVVPSLAWSVHQTAVSPSTAFFVTTTRLWELGIGAAVAVASLWWTRIPRVGAVALGLLGTAALAWSGLAIRASDPWPGSLALVPVLGTAALIIAGVSAPDTGISRILAWRPFVWIGGISYSLYLWHWLFIVAGTAHWGQLGAKRGLLLTALAFIPAWLSHRLVENPVRFNPRLAGSNALSLSLGANLSLVAAVVGLVLCLPRTITPAPTTAPPSGESSPPFGAAAILADPAGAADLWTVETSSTITPAPDAAPNDRPDAYDKGCQVDQVSGDPVACTYGDPGGAATVIIVGDSKILQWLTAIDTIGKRHHWRVVTYTKSTCSFTAAPNIKDGKPYPSCDEWNEKVVPLIVAEKPRLVLTSQNSAKAGPAAAKNSAGTAESMIRGLEAHWSTLKNAGIPVIAIANNAAPEGNVYECVAQNPDSLSECSFDAVYPTLRVQQTAADAVGVPVVNMADMICPDDKCPAVVGGVLVYRQGSHLTSTYVDTIEPELDRRLRDAVKQTDARGLYATS